MSDWINVATLIVAVIGTLLTLFFGLMNFSFNKPKIWRCTLYQRNHHWILNLVITTGTINAKFDKFICKGYKAWQCPDPGYYTPKTHFDIPWNEFEKICHLDWNFIQPIEPGHVSVEFLLESVESTSSLNRRPSKFLLHSPNPLLSISYRIRDENVVVPRGNQRDS